MQVPGDVTCALVDAGIIEEPFLKTNTKKNLWIRDLSWWLIKEFEVTAETLEEDIVRLNIEMLDFNADILLNGMRVAHHENAFCAFSEDVKRFLQVGKNQLVIRLTSGMELHYPKDSVSYYCASDNAICDQRVYTRKPQFTYGWDWCQPVPTCGIGRSIEIEAFSGAKVSAARVDTLKLDGGDAEIEFNFEIEKSNMVQSAETEIEYALEIDGETVYTGRQTKMLVGGINYVSERVTLQGAKLWWPNGYGAQNLYTFTARCTARGVTNEMPESASASARSSSTPRSSRTARAISSSRSTARASSARAATGCRPTRSTCARRIRAIKRWSARRGGELHDVPHVGRRHVRARLLLRVLL